MLWNILLAVIGASCQFVSAWFGYKVTGKDLSDKARRFYDAAFIVVGFIGIACVGLIAYRSSMVERAHFLFTPGLNYSFDKSFYAPTANQWAQASDFFPVGSPISLQMNYENVGSGPAINATHGGRVYIEPDYSLASNRDAILKFDAWVKLESHLTRTTIAKDGKGYVTFEGDILTPEDLQNITSGRRVVFAVGTFWFDDDFGAHYHNICEFLQPPMEGGKLIFATCHEHTDEK